MEKRHYHLTSLNESGTFGIYTNFAIGKRDANSLARQYRKAHAEIVRQHSASIPTRRYGMNGDRAWDYSITLETATDSRAQWYALNPCYMECADDEFECNHIHEFAARVCYFCDNGVIPVPYDTLG